MVTLESNYSAWIIVTGKKILVRNGRCCETNQPPHQGGKTTKGNMVITGEEVGPSTSKKQLIRTTQPPYVKLGALNLVEQAESSEDIDTHMQPKSEATFENMMEIYLAPSSSGKEGIKASVARLPKPHWEKKLIGTKNTKAFKRFSSAIGSKINTLLKAAESLPKKENEPNHSNCT